MTEFLLDNLLLLPFLFVTYLALEMMEARAGGALERNLGRTRRFGPLFGALSGAFPQCGFSAAAASLYAGGAITAGTLIAVFLSTSDELIPVFISEKVPLSLLLKIVAVKVVAGSALTLDPAAQTLEVRDAWRARKPHIYSLTLFSPPRESPLEMTAGLPVSEEDFTVTDYAQRKDWGDRLKIWKLAAAPAMSAENVLLFAFRPAERRPRNVAPASLGGLDRKVGCLSRRSLGED